MIIYAGHYYGKEMMSEAPHIKQKQVALNH